MESQEIRVLLVDDDQGDFEMFRVMLSKAEHRRFKVDWVSNFDEAMDAFRAGNHDVYVLDYFLEDRTGLDLLREARSQGIEAPIIMLTGRGSRSVDMEAMELGASDYLVKGLIDPDALERSIDRAMGRQEDPRAGPRQESVGGQAADRLAGGGVSAEGSSLGPPPTPTPTAGGLHGDAARFREIFQATGSAVALLNLEGKFLEVNPAFAEVFPMTRGGTEDLSYLDLLDENDREAVARELDTLASGERGRFESARRFLAEDGSILWAHTTAVLIRDQAGNPDHVMVLAERVSGGA